MSGVPAENSRSNQLTPGQRLRLEDLIDRYELAQDAGAPTTPELLCCDSPELLIPLQDALSRLNRVDQLLKNVPVLPHPQQIGEFRVLELLGTGATGMVFRCRQTSPDRDVAVKVLKPLLDADDQQERFQRELAVFGAIREEGIAEVYRSGVIDWCGVRCVWIAMELLDQGDICQHVKAHQKTETEILQLFRVLCETLRSAHRLGILHRDIKPSNILMSADGKLHLVDFGIARLPRSIPGAQQTETGKPSLRGTTAWMAPELLLGDHLVCCDIRSEIFSLGVVLFEMLTGQHPFDVEGLTTGQVAVRIAQNQPTCFRKLYPSASPDLILFVSTLMSFSADERYQNLDAVLADLARIQCGEPVLSRVVPIGERARRVIRRHRGLFTSAVILLLMSSATIVVWYRAERAEKATAAAQKVAAAANEALEASREKIKSARKTAGLHLRLLKEHTVRPAFRMPQSSKDYDEQLRLLRDAREGFTELLTTFPEDREIRESAGIAFHLLGIASNRLELFNESMGSFRRAEQIFEGLQKDYPEHGEYAFDIFSTALGQSGAALGTKQSFELHQFCLDLIRRLCQQHPDDMDYADAMACVLVELGFDYTRPEAWQDLAKARQLAMEAHELAKAICRRPKFNPLHRKHIATSASVLRVIERLEGRYDASLNWAKITVREQTLFIRDFPDRDSKSVLIRYLLAEAQDSLETGDTSNARKCLIEATERFEAMAAALAGHSEYQVLQESLRSLKEEIERVEARGTSEAVP